MSDETCADRDAEVRRLLADARHDQPLPDHVVTRLDRVLADLAAEPARVAAVTDLAGRRRLVTRLLLAAAVVVVAGVGIQQVVLPDAQFDEPASTRSGDDTAGDAPAAESFESESESGSGDGAGTTSGEVDNGAVVPGELSAQGLSDLPRLRPRHFTTDAFAARDAAVFDVSDRAELKQTRHLAAYVAAGVVCRADTWGRGRFVGVTYGRTPAVLVFRRALGDTQVADLFVCGATEPTRSVTLPAP